MATFPKLKSGALAQYPTSRTLEFSTEVHTFLDSREQRFRNRARARRRWRLDLSQLDSAELATLRAFVEERRGAFEGFDFVDPGTADTVSNCRFVGDIRELLSSSELSHAIILEVVEIL